VEGEGEPVFLMQQYLPILIQVVVAVVFAASALLISVLLGKSARGGATKDSAYECGMIPQGEVQPRFSVKFYLVAMLFILFDIEIVFMYPWAVVYRDFLLKHGASIFWSMLSFAAVLTVGYVYAILKGALDWKK
jgi:NADH-quinone oxidoreductase subunit A